MNDEEDIFELPEDILRHVVSGITAFNTDMADVASGLRIGVLVTIPVIIGVYTGNIFMGLVGTLGTFAFSMVEIPRFPIRPQMKHLFVSGAVDSLAFTAGTLAGLTGELSIPILGAAFFVAAYLTRNNGTTATGLVACVLFSLGLGLPGDTGVQAALGRLEVSFGGELLGLTGAIVQMALLGWMRHRNENPEIPEQDESMNGPTISYRKIIEEAGSASSFLRTRHLSFSVAFGTAGAAALAMSYHFGLSREYWVLLTLAILLLRSDISTALNFTVLRIIGTVVGALVGLIVISTFTSTAMLIPFFFIFGGLFFTLRGTNFGLGTLFITPFILVLLDLPDPGNAILAVERIYDTFIAGVIAVVTIATLWAGGRIHRAHIRERSDSADTERWGP